MKLKFYKLLLPFTLLCNMALAQDKNTEATVYYGKAEEDYNNGQYKSALDEIKSAENLLGSTNPRLLYLKIEAYDKLVPADWSFTEYERAALGDFFNTVDKAKYPKEKYLEITNLSIDLKDKMTRYEQDYTVVSGSNNLSDYTAFFAKYPNSKHAKELKPGYDELVSEQQKEKKDKDEADRIAEQKRKKKLFTGVCLGNTFNIGALSSTNGSESGTGSHFSYTYNVGYMLNRYVGFFSGLGVSLNDFSTDMVELTSIDLRLPIYVYANSSTRHRAGFYIQAGITLNKYVANLSGDGYSADAYNSFYVGEFASCGLSVRSKSRKNTFLLGLFYRSEGNMYNASIPYYDNNTLGLGRIHAYGLQLAWMGYPHKHFRGSGVK